MPVEPTLNRLIGQQVRRVQVQRCGERGRVRERRTPLGISVRHPDSFRRREITFETHGYRPNALFKYDFALARWQPADPGQHPGGADGGMTGKRQFAPSGEDAHAGDGIRSRWRENKRGFGQIHLHGDGLHLRIGEAVGGQKDGQLIAAEDAIGEDVDLDERVAARHALQGSRAARGPDYRSRREKIYVAEPSRISGYSAPHTTRPSVAGALASRGTAPFRALVAARMLADCT